MKKLLVALLGLLALAIVTIAVPEMHRRRELEEKMLPLLDRVGAASARTALREIGRPAVPYLRRMLADSRRSLSERERCIEILASMGPDARGAIPAVIKARNEAVRRLEKEYEVGVDAESGYRMAPYYRFVRTADDAIRAIGKEGWAAAELTGRGDPR